MKSVLIAPCGMNCGLCLHYLRPENKCPGCYTGRKVNGKDIKCGIRLCKQRQGTYCFKCNTFPCERLKRLDKRYREKYGMSEIENLRAIKESGVVCFMKHEEERWINVDGVLCVHDKKRYRPSHLDA
jgi:hypothetical protein